MSEAVKALVQFGPGRDVMCKVHRSDPTATAGWITFRGRRVSVVRPSPTGRWTLREDDRDREEGLTSR